MDIRSNEPFWLVKNSLPQSYPSLKINLKADALIIGGGITGALIAYQLIEKGVKTILVDRRDVCHGSTAASTSILQYEIDVPLHKLIDQVGLTAAVTSYQSCKKAIFRLGDIAKEIKSPCGFEETTSVYFSSSQRKVAFLENEFKARKQHGFKVKWLTGEQLQVLGLNAYAAIESKASAVLDVYVLANDLLNYCASKGMQIYDRTEIAEISPEGQQLVAKTATGFQILVNDVIHCTGYESVNTLKDDVVALKSTYALASEAFAEIPKVFYKRVFWNTDDPYLYFRGTPDNRIIMGGGDENFKNAKLRDKLLPKKEKYLHKKFNQCFPDIQFTPDYSWAGTFGETEDGLPYFGKPDPKRNEHYILGFGGNGITFSVMGMEAIVHSLKNTPHSYLEYYKFNR